MCVVMNMSNYEIERDSSMETEYGEEVLYAGWNPAVTLACQQLPPVSSVQRLSIPSSLAVVDMETFLQKMYAYQR